MFAVVFLLLIPNAVTSAGVTAADGQTSIVVDDVSGSRIMETVMDLEAFGSRAFYLESSREAAGYIYDRFEELGLHVEYQKFMIGSTEAANVVAVLNGTSPDAPQFLFGAHYDSENRMVKNFSDALNMPAPGADDDASGIAAIIELARVLSTMNLNNTIKFVAFDAEEYGYDASGGLKGSTYFTAQDKAAGTEYVGTAILDMVGYKEGQANIVFGIVDDKGNAFAKRVLMAVDKYDINLGFEVHVDPSITFSDHSPFWQAGYPSMLVIEELSTASNEPVNPFYHTSNDTSDRLSEDQMEEVTKAMAAGLLELLSTPRNTLALVIVVFAAAVAAVIIVVLYRHNRKGKG
ncbi:MAG: M20/M25/M40 family metallo-hydrolase [Thermoplasmata archaeon]